MKREALVPLTGIAFVVVLIISFLVNGEPTEAKKGVDAVVKFYDDNGDAVQSAAAISVGAVILLVFFAGHLRKVLALAEGPAGRLSSVAFAGAVIVAVGVSIDAMLLFSMAEAVKNKVDGSAVLALQTLWDNDFFPMALGTSLFMLASGLSIVRHGALPKWLGYIAIVIGLTSITPIGFAGAIAAAVWILVVSVLLTLAARQEEVGPQATTLPPQPA